MSAPTDEAIFDFLTGSAPKPGSAAARVRNAVLNPGTDREADDALDRFRKRHQNLLDAPAVADAVRVFQAKLVQVWDQKCGATANLPLAEELPDSPTWRDLYEKLLTSCQEALGRAGKPQTPTAAIDTATAEGMVATIVSNYVAGAEAQRYGDLRNPKQLWPVLLEMTARKVRRKLSAATVNDPKFADALGKVLKVAFEEVATDDRRRLILAHTLLGRTPDQIGAMTRELPEVVTNVVRALHADLHVQLTA